MYHLHQAAYSRGEISIEIFIDREIFSGVDKPEHFILYLMLLTHLSNDFYSIMSSLYMNMVCLYII